MPTARTTSTAAAPTRRRSRCDVSPDVYAHFGIDFSAGWPDRFGRLLHSWASGARTRPIRTLSIFSGAGGLDVGFRDAGFRIHTMVDADADCVATLRANSGPGRCFGRAGPVRADIRQYEPPERRADFVIGCPPCQSFSAAGRRVEGVGGTDEERGTLFEPYIRILQHLSPRGFLFENVPGIVTAQGGRAWREILAAFEAAGYRVAYRVLDAADYGVPQHRERLVLVGTRGDRPFCFPAPTHGPDSPARRPYFPAGIAIDGAAITETERKSFPPTRYGPLLVEIPAGMNYSFFTARMGHPRPQFGWRSRFWSFLYKADPDRPARTLLADAGQCTGPFHWENRPLGLAERMRLQTFPDDYCLVGGRGSVVRQIGNAVPCQFARILAVAILRQVFDVATPFNVPLLGDGQKLGFHARKRSMLDVYLQTAVNAAKSLPASEPATVSPRSYRAVLTPKFEWDEESQAAEAFSVRFRPHRDKWAIHVSSGRGYAEAFTVTITPAKEMEEGGVPRQVVLTGDVLRADMFTGVWKAFESELSRSAIGADLVDFGGYFRCRQLVTCSLAFGRGVRKGSLWRAVQVVVGRAGVGRTLPASELGQLWGVPRADVRKVAEFLRTLGYEVRSCRTNAQIPAGHLLVPYPYPTLAPSRVQRHKML